MCVVMMVEGKGRCVMADVLTVRQKSALGFLSYKYGNGGSLHSADNHKFLQLHIKGLHDDAKSLLHRITPDCLAAFSRIVVDDYRELSPTQRKILDGGEKGYL
jgi:hypothetical protein